MLFDFEERETLDDWADAYPTQTRTFRWVERKYVNLGLLGGQKRSATKDDLDQTDFSELGTLHRELHRTCPEELWKGVSNQFIYQHGNLLKSIKVPWFVPEWAGGVGLHASKDDVSEHDLRCITIIKRNWHDCHRRPMPISLHADWKMHKKVLARMEKIAVSDVERKYVAGKGDMEFFDSEDNYSRLYKYLTVETLFYVPEKEMHDTLMDRTMATLYKLMDKYPWFQQRVEGCDGHLDRALALANRLFPFEMNPAQRLLKHNTRVWEIASELECRGVYPDLVATSFEELAHCHMKENLPIMIDAQITHTRMIDLF